jgi:hypothetical protein
MTNIQYVINKNDFVFQRNKRQNTEGYQKFFEKYVWGCIGRIRRLIRG